MRNKLELLKTLMDMGDYKLDSNWVMNNVLNIKPNELRVGKIRNIWKKTTEK